MTVETSGKSTSQYQVPNLERAFLILELLARHGRGLGLSEIVEILEIPKNSVFRITTTLLNRRYLLRDEDSKRFTLSRKFLALGYAAVSEHSLVVKSLDVMRELRDILNETVLLGTILDIEGVVIEQVPGTHSFRFMVDAGARYPLHASAPGKVMLAFLPEAERSRVVDRMAFEGFNERTITCRDRFCEELKKVREKGYGVDHGEELKGVHCVAAPGFDQHGFPVSSVWVTGPSDRMPKREFPAIGRTVIEHAERISTRLGYGLL